MESEAAMAAKKKDAAKEKDTGAAPEHGGDGAEVAEERVQVVEYAAAIDVAKGSGMVCTRVPGSRPDRGGSGSGCGGWRLPTMLWSR